MPTLRDGEKPRETSMSQARRLTPSIRVVVLLLTLGITFGCIASGGLARAQITPPPFDSIFYCARRSFAADQMVFVGDVLHEEQGYTHRRPTFTMLKFRLFVFGSGMEYPNLAYDWS